VALCAAANENQNTAAELERRNGRQLLCLMRVAGVEIGVYFVQTRNE